MIKRLFLVAGLLVFAGALALYVSKTSTDRSRVSTARDSAGSITASRPQVSGISGSARELVTGSEPSNSNVNRRAADSSVEDSTLSSPWYAGMPRELASQQWLEANGFDTQMQRDSAKLMMTDSEGHSALADSGNIYALSQRATGAVLQNRDAAARDYWKAALLGSVEAIEKLGVMSVDSSLLEVDGNPGSSERETILMGAAYLVVASRLTDGVAGSGRLAQAVVEHQISDSEFADICEQALEISEGLHRDRLSNGWATHGMHKPPADMAALASPSSCNQ